MANLVKPFATIANKLDKVLSLNQASKAELDSLVASNVTADKIRDSLVASNVKVDKFLASRFDEYKQIVEDIHQNTDLNIQELQNVEFRAISREVLPNNGTIPSLPLADLPFANERGLHSHHLKIPLNATAFRVEFLDDALDIAFHVAGANVTSLSDSTIKALKNVDPLSNIYKTHLVSGVRRSIIIRLANLRGELNSDFTHIALISMIDAKLGTELANLTKLKILTWFA